MIHTPDWVGKWAVYTPDQVALEEAETGRQLTYWQWNQQATHLAYQLHQQFGLRKGDRMVILSENVMELYLLFAVAQKMGFILVPLNYRMTPAEIAFLIQDADPQLLILENQFRGKVEVGISTPIFSIDQIQDFCSSIDQRIHIELEAPSMEEDDPIFILYTSGTTGFPKGAIYSHKMLFWNSVNTAVSLIVNSMSRTINCLPPFHTGGWNVLTTPFIHHGGYTYFMRSFDAAAVLKHLVKERATLFMGVPTVLRMIADLPTFDQADLSSLHYIIVGGEPMPIPLINRYHEKGIPIRQGYGMTEVGPNLTSLHQADAIRKKGSIGRPNFYVQTKIVDSNNQPQPTGQAGELLLKGPMVTPGYWNRPEATKKAIRDGWFYTGDLVKQDDEGYLYVVDRIKNMYISGGENVYPAEVERILNGMSVIKEVVVIGVPDKQWGEVGAAIIVSEDDRLSLEDVQRYCKAYLAKFKIPKYIRLVSELPKSDTGKLDRRKLRQTFVEAT